MYALNMFCLQKTPGAISQRRHKIPGHPEKAVSRRQILDRIVLSMEEQLVLERIGHDDPLQTCYGICNINSHARRNAHEDTGPSAEVLGELLQHEWNVWAPILCPPAILLLCGEEGETHQALLELGRSRREAKVKAAVTLLRRDLGTVEKSICSLAWRIQVRLGKRRDFILILPAKFFLSLFVTSRLVPNES